jgi:hypothetical protein
VALKVLKHYMATGSSRKVARVLMMDEEELMEIDSPLGLSMGQAAPPPDTPDRPSRPPDKGQTGVD